jgi:predicted RNA-binding Zn-ribbon protein involved in translation (DUF1610 family)
MWAESPSRVKGRKVLLALALDQRGERTSIRSLDPERRRALAPFTCIGCGDVVVARLGRVRARHFAHRPGSSCPFTNPETALHLEAKERLLELCREAFAARRSVVLATRCPGCHRLVPLDLAAQGDAACAEATVGDLRVDVLVTRRGSPALAFEVRVSHALDAAKEAELARRLLPTLEIDAHEPFEEVTPDGVFLRASRSLGFPPCPTCDEAARTESERALGGEDAALAELEAYRSRGLFGARPGPHLDPSPSLSLRERGRIEAEFVCPDCGRRGLEFSRAIARHACAGRTARPVAWHGYDGTLVLLTWWRPSRR